MKKLIEKINSSEIYIPKRWLLSKEEIPEFFKVVEDKDFARRALLGALQSNDWLLYKWKYADKENYVDIYSDQECSLYFDDETNKKYFWWFYNEGREIMLANREIAKKWKADQKSFAFSLTNEELGKLIGSELMLQTAYQNWRNWRKRCNNTTVPSWREDMKTNATHMTSNYALHNNWTCPLKENVEFYRDKEKVSAVSNCHICKDECGKPWCSEQNFLEHCKKDALMDPNRCFWVFPYDELNFWGCSNCDKISRLAWLYWYMVLTQPNRLYINAYSPNFEYVTNKLYDRYWEYAQQSLF